MVETVGDPGDPLHLELVALQGGAAAHLIIIIIVMIILTLHPVRTRTGC